MFFRHLYWSGVSKFHFFFRNGIWEVMHFFARIYECQAQAPSRTRLDLVVDFTENQASVRALCRNAIVSIYCIYSCHPDS